MSDQTTQLGIAEDTIQARELPEDLFNQMVVEGAAAAEPQEESAAYAGSVGRTMFDSPASEDNTVTILLPNQHIGHLPSQALVRIRSLSDHRSYLAIVTAGPFAEPTGLRADSPPIVLTTVKQGVFMPPFHGRLQAEILGEELDGQLVPPRFRPLPNSPVFPLTQEETEAYLRTSKGKDTIRIGLAIGHEDLKVGASMASKQVFPRHLAVLGTTGAGKSTTISGMVRRFQKQGAATILIDTEGEYSQIHEPTDDPRMLDYLKRLKQPADGVAETYLYHLVGREPSNPEHPHLVPFSLAFDTLSPYTVMEILELPEAQQNRFMQAYEVGKALLQDLRIFPRSREADPRGEDQDRLNTYDELESGYPRLLLAALLDVVSTMIDHLTHKGENGGGRQKTAGTDAGESALPVLRADAFSGHDDAAKFLQRRLAAVHTDNPASWRALAAKLWRLNRLHVFDNPRARRLVYDDLVTPGRVSIIDLSDTDSTHINNLVIADILRAVQQRQEVRYKEAVKAGQKPTPVITVIEEAHEFLSAQRIGRMPVLFQQVARIARRGRKRWLGLVFVTQLPQHLPDEVLGLVNSFILHKIADGNVISRLKRSIGNIDDSLWRRLPSLAPGQAIVSLAGMLRPLLVAVDPTPCQLRLVD